MKKAVSFIIGCIIPLAAVIGLSGCSSEENSISSPPPGPQTISISYANPLEIEIDTTTHWALLLHDRRSSRGTAIQLIDIEHRSVLNTRILDYYDVYDIAFLPNDQACFVGRTQDRMEYAVQFLTLPDLELGTRVVAADTAGEHGYLAVDTQHGFVYYSHAGGGDKDGLYKISIATKTLVNAAADDNTRKAFDNDLVEGLFDQPARLFYDRSSQKLMVANRGGDYITQLDASLWGTLRRGDNLNFPIAGALHLNTLSGSLGSVRADGMAAADNGVFIFAGTSDGTAFLSRTEINATLAYPPETMPGYRQWKYHNSDILVHSGEDIRSVFVLQSDSARIGIGRYNLNNLRSVSGSPYRTRAIPDTSISAVGLDAVKDVLVVGDAHQARLELIEIR